MKKIVILVIGVVIGVLIAVGWHKTFDNSSTLSKTSEVDESELVSSSKTPEVDETESTSSSKTPEVDETELASFVRSSFSDYGLKTLPNETEWIIKYEGQGRIVIIVDKGSKMILDEQSDTFVLRKVIINNRMHYQNFR